MTIYVLDDELRKLIAERGWNSLTPVQLKAFPEIVSGKNTLIVAPTGWGKTEAAILPILQLMLKERPKPVSLLYITPLRALINDIVLRLKWWGDRLGFRVARKHGDVSSSEKAKRLRKVPHIMVTTPESLEIDLDCAQRFRRHLLNVKWVIVDEVHELVQSKRGTQLSVLLERLMDFSGRDFQRIGLSATVGDTQKVLEFLAGGSSRPFSIINYGFNKPLKLTVKTVRDGHDDIWSNVAKIIASSIEPPSLIFVNSRFTSERLHEALEELGLSKIYVHHSSVSRDDRWRVEEKLKKGDIKAVVCTKTLELGIDIGFINNVIQFRPTASVSTLLQRIGRSGHEVDSECRGILLGIGPIDALENVATAILAVEREIEKPKIPVKPLDVLAKEILGMCMQYGSISPIKVYKVVKRAYPYRDLKFDEVLKVFKYLNENELIVEEGHGRFKLGSGFYRLWRFNHNGGVKKWWSRNFTEFFSTIAERDSFSVKHGDRHVGDLDSGYVYRYLRVGDIVRLSGRSWRVLDIDDNIMRIEVLPSEPGESEVPIWRGEGIRTSSLITSKAAEILESLSGASCIKIPNGVSVDEETIRELSKLVNYYRENDVPLPSNRRMVIEKVGDETYFTMLMGEDVANTIAHVIMYLITSTNTLNVSIKSSSLGFYIKVAGADPVEIFLKMSPEILRTTFMDAVRRSPVLFAVMREIQTSFGKIGKPDFDRDVLIVEEAARQAIENYFNIEEAVRLLERISSGDVEVVVIKSDRPSPIAEAIKKIPSERPWTRDASIIIVKTLEGLAFTVDELSEILRLPPRTVESRLKELRKPGTKDRVFQFIDVELGEWRWALVRDLPRVMKSSEFQYCFTPLDYNEAFILMVKPHPGSSYYSIYFTPKDTIRDPSKLKKRIPYDELYEVKVMPLSDNLLKSLAPKYYYISVEILPYIALNGVSFIQNIRQSA